MAVVITRTADPAGVAGVSNVVTYSSVSIGSATADRLVVLCVGAEAAASSVSATADWGLGDTAATTSSGVASFPGLLGRVFVWAIGGAATTATFKVTYTAANPGATANHVAVYKVTGAKAILSASGVNTSTDMD